MRIGEMALRAGVSRDTLRFYEKRGLVRSSRHGNGYRDYGEEAGFVVDYIRRAQALGFSLAEIEADLPALTQTGISQERVVEILRAKLKTIDDKIAGMSKLRHEIAAMIDQACPVRASNRR
jgi:MerR family copper efflux transcriptional regulator